MNNSGICPPPILQAGDRLYGFRVLRVQEIPDIRVRAYEITHEQTGAHVLHLHNDDRENLFSIGFRTPAKDSTGVAHILEHSVLAGSERYPVKDAFNELAKGSLKTFINAFTYPDKTVYPVASQVKTDFFNLARVYTDLVLSPRLSLSTFLQEGHHLEPVHGNDPDSDLTISGIVYNEMKGVYSSVDSLIYKALLEGLYPDNTYGLDSGGDPDEIPKLTFDQFKYFHKAYYSPSNAWFFLYGDISTGEHLSFLREMLSGFNRVEVDSRIGDQPRWSEIRRIHQCYPIGREEPLERKSVVNLGWMTAGNLEPEEILLLQIAAIVLVGTAGAPLRKALIDSGLGEDLSPATGLDRDLKQVPFFVGLRGTDPDKADRIEKLVFSTMAGIVQQGFDRQLIEGALHQVEFHGREISRNVMPYSITLMSHVYQTWLYDGDPLIGLQFSTLIEKIRQRWSQQSDLFEKVVDRWFLENKHCLVVTMEPSRSYQEKKEADFLHKMADVKASLNGTQLREIHRQAEILRKEQMSPDSPEALATLPRLELKDIPGEIETIPTHKTSIFGLPGLEHELFANGIAYLDLAFDVSDVSDDLQPLLPLLGQLTLGMGAGGKSYDEMSSRIALKMGGLTCTLSAGRTVGGLDTWQKMTFRMKVLHRNIKEAVQLLGELLTQGDLTNRARMRDLIAEGKNHMISSVVPAGHIFAKKTASAGLSLASHRDEQWSGLGQLRTLSFYSDRFTQEAEGLQQTLSSLKAHIFRQGRLTVNLTGDAAGLAELRKALDLLLTSLPSGGEAGVSAEVSLKAANFGITIPAQVCYVAQVLQAPTYLSDEASILLVLSHELSSGLLYKRIRVQGGAYGGFSSYDPLSGEFAFLSYRDPNLEETLKVYQEAVEEMSMVEIPEDELRKAVISTIASLDKPMGPGTKGYVAMVRDFCGLTDEHRREFRSRVLKITTQSLRQVAAAHLRTHMMSSVLAAYAAEDRLKRANEQISQKLQIQNII
ncbi:MAG: insulinase family protein [bacterium]